MEAMVPGSSRSTEDPFDTLKRERQQGIVELKDQVGLLFLLVERFITAEKLPQIDERHDMFADGNHSP